MTILVRVSALLVCLLFVLTTATTGQTNLLDSRDLSEVSIDSYTNEEIKAFYEKAIESGLDDQQIFSLLAQRGMPQSEIAKLRDLLQLSKTGGNRKFSDIPYADTADQQRSARYDTVTGRIPIQSTRPNTRIFGAELFSTNSLVFEPNLRIPPPANYMLGPDDEIIITVFGYSEKKYTLRVNEVGEIYIPNVGPIDVAGLTLEQATEKIRNRLASTIYSAIRTGQTKVHVTLGRIKSIRVTVIGQAKRPATYTVSSLTTLFNLLYLCGGPTEIGSFRSIEIIRGNEKKHADLYDFLVYGNQKDNILLQEGDVIRIPYYENRVELSGNVKREGLYELQQGETFSNLLQYSGGFTDNAYRAAVSVERITDSSRKIIDLPSDQFGSFVARGSDKFTVRELQDEFGNRVYISGAVLRPGPYALTEGTTVADLIGKAGGLKVEAFTERALIYRYQHNKLPEMKSVNLDSVLTFGQTVLLRKNDSLVVSSLFNFRDLETVSVEGMVRMPGQTLWRKSLTLQDVLQSAGGITEYGDSTTVEISRRMKDANVQEANHLESKVFVYDLKSRSGLTVELQPYDIVIVKEKPGYVQQRTVLVRGAILNPGIYTLEKSGARISDVINRTNGFKASADSSSLIIRRIKTESITSEERRKLLRRVLSIDEDSLNRNPRLKSELESPYDLISVDLATIMKNPRISENIQLEDGDILTIERNSNLVRVNGEVYFPTIIPYVPNKTLKYYVQQAGNFMPKARKNGSVVIYPNGRVASVKSFLFFKSYPSVVPRSEIVVPQKDTSNRSRITAAEWAVMISALGILSNVILNVTK